MLDKKVLSVFIALLIFFPSVIFAQEMMDGKWWQNRIIAKKLEITKTEKQQLEAIYIKSRRNLINLKSEVEKARFEIDVLLDGEDSQKAAIMDQYNRLETARGSLSAERFNLLLGMREIVGIERYQQLKSLHRMKRDKRTKRSKDKKRKGDD
jgi:Spy/CpxP family protein refolding chaperone